MNIAVSLSFIFKILVVTISLGVFGFWSLRDWDSVIMVTFWEKKVMQF